MKNILLLIVIVFSVHLSFAQEVNGLVYENGINGKEALIGANVYWLGSTIGTTTNFDGEFSIENNRQYKKLVISYIGYESDTVLVGNKDLEVFLKNGQYLDEVVVNRRKAGTFVDRASAIQTATVTGAELCKAACCNLSESFTTNASIDVSFSDAVTGAKQIQLLGLSGAYVQLLTENMPNYTGLATNYGLEYIPGSWMSSIQISKGAAAVINGYEAITGQINVEYKKPQKSEPIFINALINTATKKEININSAYKYNDNLSYMFLAHAENSTGKSDENSDGFLDLPLVTQYNFLNRWMYKTSKFSYDGGVKFIYEDRLAGQEKYDFDKENTKENGFGIKNEVKRVEIFNKGGYVFSDDGLTSIGLITNIIYHKQNSFFGLKDYDAVQKSLYTNLVFQSIIGSERHKYSTGISFKHDNFVQELTNLDNSNTGIISTFNRNENVPGVFFQYTYSIKEKINFIAGIRYDNHNQYGGFITPRLHLKYNINKNSLFRLSAGKGYRTSNIIAENTSFFASTKKLIIDNNLNMEEAWNYGINFTQFAKIFKRKITFNLDYYRTDFINQVIADLDENPNVVHFKNLDGDSYSNNYQIEVSGDIVKGLQTMVAFRYTDVKVTTGGELKEKALTSRYKGLLNLSYQTPLNKWQFDFTTQLNGGGRLLNNEEFDPYTILNAQITKRFKLWEIYVGSENLTGFKQKNPIANADKPFEEGFDATQVWGPIDGVKVFVGMRFSL